MFEHHSHSYFAQVASLWLSFVPGIAILGLIAGAQIERVRRIGWHHARAVRMLQIVLESVLSL